MDFIDLILHVDEHLAWAIDKLGIASYFILFLIIFAETGFVVIPFLPGDSLLFAAGALAGGGMLNLGIVIPSLIAAAIIGDSVNYMIGERIGERVFARKNARFFNPEHLKQTQEFYAKHGGKTIILARFLPIVRTFAPFIAGVGSMRYKTFLLYNVIGAVLWVVSMTLAGYFFGSIPFIKHNFEYVVILIVLLSIIPAVIEFIKHRRDRSVRTGQSTNLEELKETFEKEGLND